MVVHDVGGGCRVGGRGYTEAPSSPNSLARTSPRTRYCRPRTAGEHAEQNVSLRDVLRGPPPEEFVMDTIFAKVAGLDVHHKFITVAVRCRLDTGKPFAEVRYLRDDDQGPQGDGRLPASLGRDARGTGIDRRALEAGLEHLGRPVHPAAGQPAACQAGARPQVGRERRRVDRPAVAVRAAARQLRAAGASSASSAT